MRKNNQNNNMDDIGNKKRKDTAIDGPQGRIGDPGEHKNIHTDGRCDEADFRHSDHDHAEPDRIKTHGHDGGVKNGYRKYNTREYFQKHAENDVEYNNRHEG